MITPSPNVPREVPAQADARFTPRTDRGADFREVVTRGREQAREQTREETRDVRTERERDAHRTEREGEAHRTERERDADRTERARDARRTERAQAADRARDAGGPEDTARSSTETSDASGDDTTQPESTASPRDQASNADARDAARTRVAATAPTDVESALDGALHRARALLDLVPEAAASETAAGSTDVASAFAVLDVPPTSPPIRAAGSAAATSPNGSASADPAALAASVEAAPTATDAAGREIVDASRARNSASSADARSGIVAITPQGPSIATEVAAPATNAPVASARLAPAELPQFLEKLAVRVDGAAGSAFVELEPVELGRLTVELSLQPEGGVRAEVRAERPDGYAAIEARLPELRASLMGRGFASADIQLSLGLSQRDARRDSDAADARRDRRAGGRDLETERVLALAPSNSGSIDLWA